MNEKYYFYAFIISSNYGTWQIIKIKPQECAFADLNLIQAKCNLPLFLFL